MGITAQITGNLKKASKFHGETGSLVQFECEGGSFSLHTDPALVDILNEATNNYLAEKLARKNHENQHETEKTT